MIPQTANINALMDLSPGALRTLVALVYLRNTGQLVILDLKVHLDLLRSATGCGKRTLYRQVYEISRYDLLHRLSASAYAFDPSIINTRAKEPSLFMTCLMHRNEFYQDFFQMSGLHAEVFTLICDDMKTGISVVWSHDKRQAVCDQMQISKPQLDAVMQHFVDKDFIRHISYTRFYVNPQVVYSGLDMDLDTQIYQSIKLRGPVQWHQ